MSEKRKDNRGRILRDGESQRSDGQYMYRYNDAKNIRRCVYSWKLVATDKLPAGKRDCVPLREQEKEILSDLKDGIDHRKASSTTLNQFYDDYISLKYELKESTRQNYVYMYTRYIRNGLGLRKIDSIHYTDIKKLYIHLITELGFKPNSVETIQTILHPVFEAGVRDGYIRLNPTNGVLADLKKSCNWEKPKRHALTEPEQKRFVEFVSGSRTYSHWMPLFTVLLGTGGRIGEILGLRWCDCDFDNDVIDINHNLIYRQGMDGKMAFHVTTPKTKSGTRIVPMFSQVKEALLRQKNWQLQSGKMTCEIDGFSDFIFQNRNGELLNPHVVNRALARIIRDANAEDPEVPLPNFSCHNLRHTFCTRLCENERNLKVIQEIMGHRSIETTMDVYNEATKEKKISTFAKLEGKITIA